TNQEKERKRSNIIRRPTRSSLFSKRKYWIANAEERETEIQPSDSVSHVSRRSRRSSSSVRSAVSETRLRLSVKRAALEVEASSLSQQLAIAQRKLNIEQQELQLQLQTRLAKAQAQELIYKEYEDFVEVGEHSLRDNPQTPTNIPESVPETHHRVPAEASGRVDVPDHMVPVNSAGELISPIKCDSEGHRGVTFSRSLDPVPMENDHRVPVYESETHNPMQSTPLNSESPEFRCQSPARNVSSSVEVLESLVKVQDQVERQLKAQRLPRPEIMAFDGNP
ncbi:predicted protein, partial [Nematostella vectensis]